MHLDVVLSRAPHDIRPEAIPLLRELYRPQLENRCAGGAFPAPATATEARLDEFFTPGFRHATAKGPSGQPEFGIAHAVLVRTKVVALARHGLAHARCQAALPSVAT